jgi:hypothetical protein
MDRKLVSSVSPMESTIGFSRAVRSGAVRMIAEVGADDQSSHAVLKLLYGDTVLGLDQLRPRA